MFLFLPVAIKYGDYKDIQIEDFRLVSETYVRKAKERLPKNPAPAMAANGANGGPDD